MDHSDAAELSRSVALSKNIRDGDLVIVEWPNDVDVRQYAATQGQARLLVVGSDADPPSTWDALEDWIRAPIDRDELETRRAALMRALLRLRPVALDDFGLLRRGHDWVALSPQEEVLLRPLLVHPDRVVRRSTLLAAIGVDETDPTKRLDAAIRRLRARVRPLGLKLRTVRMVGYILELDAPPDSGSTSGL